MKGTEMDFARVNPIVEGFGEEQVAAALANIVLETWSPAIDILYRSPVYVNSEIYGKQNAVCRRMDETRDELIAELAAEGLDHGRQSDIYDLQADTAMDYEEQGFIKGFAAASALYGRVGHKGRYEGR